MASVAPRSSSSYCCTHEVIIMQTLHLDVILEYIYWFGTGHTTLAKILSYFSVVSHFKIDGQHVQFFTEITFLHCIIMVNIYTIC